MPDTSAIALFVRHPRPGAVKTRLAERIGAEQACSLYMAMVSDLLNNALAVSDTIYLFHDQDSEIGLPGEWIAAACRVVPQRGDSLGERMSRAFELIYSDGYSKALLLGSDIPGMDPELLQKGVDGIKECGAIFAPAYDGGYCLIGVNRADYTPAIFSDIPWSSSMVLELSLEACAREGVTFSVLDCRQDIDTIEDLFAYCITPSPFAPKTNKWLVDAGYPCVLE